MVHKILNLVSNDKLEDALEEMALILNNSPKLYEILHQKGRLVELNNLFRLGIGRAEDSRIERNKIRWSILDFLKEVDEIRLVDEGIEKELENYNKSSILNVTQKHYGKGHNIGGDFIKGDKF